MRLSNDERPLYYQLWLLLLGFLKLEVCCEETYKEDGRSRKPVIKKCKSVLNKLYDDVVECNHRQEYEKDVQGYIYGCLNISFD